MTNLLQETVGKITETGHRIEDVVFIGSVAEPDHWSCTWDQFATMADIDYDDGYGASEVAKDLVIMFTDGARLERAEYDGSEWWEYVPVLKPPTGPGKQITHLVGAFWPSLDDLHDPSDTHHARGH